MEFHSGEFDKARDIFIEADFEEGEYLIAMEVNWCNDLTRKCVISKFINVYEKVLMGKQDQDQA